MAAIYENSSNFRLALYTSMGILKKIKYIILCIVQFRVIYFFFFCKTKRKKKIFSCSNFIFINLKYTSLGSTDNTYPNPDLRNPSQPSGYDPAWKLTDESRERCGRENR